MGYVKIARIYTWIILALTLRMFQAAQESENSAPAPEILPTFAEPVKNLTIALGRDAKLPCIVDNLGRYRVAWIRVESKTVLTIHKHVITRNYRVNLSHSDARTFTLHINNVQQVDTGAYMCQINTVPMRSQVGWLEVVVPPDIIDRESSTDILVREGSNVTLVCKAKGQPKPTITWRREDGQVIAVGNWQDSKPSGTVQHAPSTKIAKDSSFDGEELSITKVSRLHMGAYLCIASNGVPPSVSRRILLQVHFPPMIWIPNQLVGAPLGGDVTLECHTEAYPMSINYWTRDEMIVSSEKHTLSVKDKTYKVHMKLTISKLQAEDFGTYRCFAKNSLGSTEGSIRLYEIHVPAHNVRDTSTPKALGVNEANFGLADDTLTKEPRLDIHPLPNQPEHGATSCGFQEVLQSVVLQVVLLIMVLQYRRVA